MTLAADTALSRDGDGRFRGEVEITRLASGLPVGADLEHADEVTLGRALAGRRAVDG